MIKQTRTIYAFENEMFEDITGLSLCIEEPAPDPHNPIFDAGEPGAPDDRKICYTGTVAPWGDGYGMWYQAEDRQQRLTRCFANSKDGLHWERRGTVGGEGFNAIGNSFNVYNDGGQFFAPLTALEILLPDQISDLRRRKIAEQAMASSGMRGTTAFIGMATSSDGLGWKLPEKKPVIPIKLETPRLYQFKGRYIMNAQTNGAWFDPPHKAGRIVVFFESDDLIHWKMHPTCMTNHAHEAIHGQTHCGIIPIKCIDDRLLIGLGGRFDDGTELTDQHWDITLLYSYDGLDWCPVSTMHEHRSWIRRGRRGEWDFGGVVGMGLIENGDQAAVYYNATAIGNCSHSFPMYDAGPCAVGRVCLQRDRFAALQPTVGWKIFSLPERAELVVGTLMTYPIRLSTERTLTMNVAFPIKCDRAAINIEILTPEGTVYDVACLPHGGVAVPVPLTKPPLDSLVQIRITMTGESAPDAVPRFFAMEY